MAEIRTGMANYSLHPLQLRPHEVLQWAHDNGAEGVLFSDLTDSVREELSVSYLRDLGQMARDLGMYLEWGNGKHIPFSFNHWSPADIMPANLRAAAEAEAIGTKIIRTCSEGMLRANPANPATPVLLKETAAELKRIMPMLNDYGVVLAIETHFEFTSFELLRLFEMVDARPGGSIGICLDTMNLLTMLENPVEAAARLMPWVVCTHIKDGGLVFNSEGLTAFPAALGTGIVDIESIIRLILKENRNINLSAEGHGGSYLLPVHEPWYINQFPDLTISEYNNLMLLEDKAERLIETGKLVMTSVPEWNSVCEARTRSDLKKLKEIHERCR